MERVVADPSVLVRHSFSRPGNPEAIGRAVLGRRIEFPRPVTFGPTDHAPTYLRCCRHNKSGPPHRFR